MQQPLSQQPDQIGPPQTLGQQMVLCPVRLVYETQILVQPGSHIQPNQTFFVNPHNPPPWMQNTLQNTLQNSLQARPAIQNQVVYVQQMPNNMVSAIQQPMDQNQMYMQQNIQNFQVQQQMFAQNSQEIRPAVQFTNVMPNMVQNIQTNVPNERNVHNRQMQNNPQIIQNQIVHRPIQNQVINQPQQIQGQEFMRPQVPQLLNIQRPVMTVNQMQAMQQQTLANLQNVGQNTGQTFTSNGSRQSPNINTVRTSVPNNIASIQAAPKLKEITPANVELPGDHPVGSGASNVRPLAPNFHKPMQPRNYPNFKLDYNETGVPKVTQHIPVQTIQTMPVYNNSHQNVVNNYAIKQELNSPINNKRKKSEAPDESKNKMVATPTFKPNNSMQITAKPNFNSSRENMSKPNFYNTQQKQNTAIPGSNLVNEIGTNTSPVHRIKMNPQLQMNNNQSVTKSNSGSPVNFNNEISSLMEKDKLIRNTVYTQARGRLLQDKSEEAKLHQVEITSENIEQPKHVEEKKIEPKLQQNHTEMTITPIEPQLKPNPTEIRISAIEPKSKQNSTEMRISPIEPKSKQNATEMKISPIEPKPKPNSTEMTKNPAEAPKSMPIIPMDVEPIVKIERLNPENNKEIQAHVQIIIKNEDKPAEKVEQANKNDEVQNVVSEVEKTDDNIQEKSLPPVRSAAKSDIDILTHVVDGYVIQESNIAFPIRRPLKEKPLPANTKSARKEKKDLLKESIREELKSNASETAPLPFQYHMLDSAREEKEKAESKENEEAKERDNPFCKLQHSTVKSWTVDDLSVHLLKYKWKDTVSLLQDHEIDGESLFLVSKQQLLTIGVSDDHADLICEFVKS